jgi:hypothetical protein
VARLQGGRPATVFYPFGRPMPYASAVTRASRTTAAGRHNGPECVESRTEWCFLASQAQPVLYSTPCGRLSLTRPVGWAWDGHLQPLRNYLSYFINLIFHQNRQIVAACGRTRSCRGSTSMSRRIRMQMPRITTSSDCKSRWPRALHTLVIEKTVETRIGRENPSSQGFGKK